jgi:hypothetical protein
LPASIVALIAAHTTVQQQAQAFTTLPAGVHIGTQAFAIAGTNEWQYFDVDQRPDCDPVV